MKNNKGIASIGVLILLGLLIGAGAYVIVKKPPMFDYIEEKLKNIPSLKSLIGSLTPARDLRGTWVSSLKGKGLQLYGKFTTGTSVTKVYEDGDIELIIDSVKGNVANGRIKYTNLCGYGETTVPGYKKIVIPKVCGNLGFAPIKIKVSSSSLDFGTINVSGASAIMRGSFTTDIMSGTMTLTTSYGVIKGEFRLSRKK